MKKHIKILSVVLVVIITIAAATVIVGANTKSISAGSVKVAPGDISRVAITLKNFDGFVGGFNFEIKFPEIVKISNVYLEDEKLVSHTNGGSDYVVKEDNTLLLIGTCNYGDDFVFGAETNYYVEFTVGENARNGEHTVFITENTKVVANYDATSFVYLGTTNGTISVQVQDALKGDIDGDGIADNTDLLVLRQHILGISACGEAADMNKDGVYDILDAVLLRDYIKREVVYLSDNGNDNNVGDKQSAPVATLDRAIEQVADGGTIYITDKYTVDNTFNWSKHNKTVKITNGVLDATAVSEFSIADNVTFANTTLKFKTNANIYANGYALKIDETVTVSGKPNVYGGGSTSVKSTSLEILSGSYKYIYGGGNNADVTGNTSVIVGGNVNSDLNAADHDGDVLIIGGGNDGAVSGNTNVTIRDNVKATYVIGAGHGTNSSVTGKSVANIYGGTFVGVHGGSRFGKCYGTEVNVYGGTIEQIIGGSENQVIVGDTRINLLGGKVTRRIYGGCYNEVSGSGNWSTRFHVGGNTTVFLSSNATVQFGSFVDKGIFACTRYYEHYDDENSTIIYENEAAKTKFEGLLGQQDSTANYISSWPNAAKNYIVQN